MINEFSKKEAPIQGIAGLGGGVASRLLTIASGAITYIDDVFSTFLYDGNGSARSITNGIDLAGEGGMLWIKARNAAQGHYLFDTERGHAKALLPDDNSGEVNLTNGLAAFESDGYSTNAGSSQTINVSSRDYASWSFRKAPGFFDIVTYTGNESNPRQIAHNLGSVPGMIIVKNLSAGNWYVYHRSLNNGSNPGNYRLRLDTNNAVEDGTSTFSATATSTHFTISTNCNYASQYVAYIFAHDDQSFGQYADQSAIKCGSYTGTGNSNGPTINLGFEPQFVLIKSSSGSGHWIMYDTMRGFCAKGVDAILYANLTATEDATNQDLIKLTSRGFELTGNFSGNELNVDYVYMAVRRPNKPPTAGSQVFDVKDLNMSNTNTIVSTTLQTVDATWNKIRTANGDWMNSDRLHNGYWTRFNQLNAKQYDPTGVQYDYSYKVNPYYWAANYDHSPYMFKRRPGFFDVVSYIGDGSTSRLVPHNLEAPPEFIIIKRTSSTGEWWVYPNKPGYMMYMNRNNAEASYTAFGTHTSTAFQTETVANNDTNQSGAEYVAYLFATLPGVSKVGTYTGQSNDFDVDCGFTTGARFIMIKRTDTAADWYVMDTVNGLGAGTDLFVLPNSAAQQASQDLIDSIIPSGFKVNTSGGMPLGINGATYFFLAIS